MTPEEYANEVKSLFHDRLMEQAENSRTFFGIDAMYQQQHAQRAEKSESPKKVAIGDVDGDGNVIREYTMATDGLPDAESVFYADNRPTLHPVQRPDGRPPLLPCPCCGTGAEYAVNQHDDGMSSELLVACPECGLQMPSQITLIGLCTLDNFSLNAIRKASAAWNRRV